MVPTGLFIQDDVNNYSQHLVLLPSLIMSSWNLPLQWARIFTFTLEELILYLKMSKHISPCRAIGQVQKFAGRWIIRGLEITTREKYAFSHSLSLANLLLRHKSFYVPSPVLQAFHKWSVLVSDLHKEGWNWPHWRAQFMWWSQWPSVEYDPDPLSWRLKCSHQTLLTHWWFKASQCLKGPWS